MDVRINLMIKSILNVCFFYVNLVGINNLGLIFQGKNGIILIIFIKSVIIKRKEVLQCLKIL